MSGTHEVYMETDFPMFRLRCSCGEWKKTVPMIAGEEGMRAAAEEHRLAVFGPKLEEG